MRTNVQPLIPEEKNTTLYTIMTTKTYSSLQEKTTTFYWFIQSILLPYYIHNMLAKYSFYSGVTLWSEELNSISKVHHVTERSKREDTVTLLYVKWGWSRNPVNYRCSSTRALYGQSRWQRCGAFSRFQHRRFKTRGHLGGRQPAVKFTE